MVPARWRYAWKTSQKPTWSSTSDRRERMNKETIEALHQIEKEKGVSFEILIAALEDALHSAYKKTAGAVPFSEVHIDRESGELRVFELVFPEGENQFKDPQFTGFTINMHLGEGHGASRLLVCGMQGILKGRNENLERNTFFLLYLMES